MHSLVSHLLMMVTLCNNCDSSRWAPLKKQTVFLLKTYIQGLASSFGSSWSWSNGHPFHIEQNLHVIVYARSLLQWDYLHHLQEPWDLMPCMQKCFFKYHHCNWHTINTALLSVERVQHTLLPKSKSPDWIHFMVPQQSACAWPMQYIWALNAAGTNRVLDVLRSSIAIITETMSSRSHQRCVWSRDSSLPLSEMLQVAAHSWLSSCTGCAISQASQLYLQ